jgi:predicted nucleotidyltransferase
MNLSRPLTSLIPSLEGEVLTVLAAAEIAFTGRRVHKVIGKNSQVGVSKVLQKLVDQGIVTVQSAGTSNLYQLNREHLLAGHLIEIANLRAEFFRLMSLEVSAWELHPECVAVFGSTARSDMTTESDIDVFISRPTEIEFGDMAWRRQLTEFSLKVGKWTGNSVNAFEVGPDDVKRELGTKEGVLYSIIDHGVIVYGPSDYLRKLRSRKEAK